MFKVCLNVVGKPDAFSGWDGSFDLTEQDSIREDCRKQTGKHVEQSEKKKECLMNTITLLIHLGAKFLLN